MKKKSPIQAECRWDAAALDELIDEFTVEAAGDDERVLAFLQALEKHVALPCDGFVIGEPVSVVKFDYQGNQRRGLTAKCRRVDGCEYEVTVSEVTLATDSPGSHYLAAYRKWMGVEPYPPEARTRTRRESPVAGLDLGGPVELVVLSVKQKAARCRLLGSDQSVTLRAGRLWAVVPGEIAVVRPGTQWNYARNPYLSGVIESTRLDVAALGLVPLRLEEQGTWDPSEHYWGEEDEPIEDWAKPIIARGPRPEFEMEQVLPGADSDDPFSDPISESNDRRDSGDSEGAYKILMDLCQADLRCLDAHSHLGNLVFQQLPKDAIRHYEVGVRIGELSLGEGFAGLLPWGWIDNRPFLRCMQGFGLCLWRLGRFQEADRIFDRMLWLNPPDNQGVRFLIDDVRARVAWEKSRDG
jgi:hypothetical protein